MAMFVRRTAGWAPMAIFCAFTSAWSAPPEAVSSASIPKVPSNVSPSDSKEASQEISGRFLLQGIKESVKGSSTRIELQLDAAVAFRHRRSDDAPRIYLDMDDTRFPLSLIGKAYATHAGPVERVLLAHNSTPSTRVVLELSKPAAYSVQMLENPARLVIEIDSSKPAPKTQWRMLPAEEWQPKPESALLSKTNLLPQPQASMTAQPNRIAPADLAERRSPAYSSSAEFDLHPRTELSNFSLRKPTVQALYNAIAAQYGIKILFDPDVTNQQTQIVGNFELESATLKEALAAAGEVSKTFVAPIDERTGIVAADTAPKRGEFERQVLASFPVDNNVTQQELTEITTALQTITDLRRIVRDPDTNRLAVLGRARQVDIAGEFLRSLQKDPGEVVVEMEILEVDEQFARSLGIVPPRSLQMILLDAAGSPASSVALNAAGRFASMFGVQLPGATGNLTLSSSSVRSRQTAQLRAVSGKQASFSVGDRVPLINGYINTSFTTDANGQTALAGAYPSIQYEDVGVVLKATPYLHAGREITLKFDLTLRGVTTQSLNGTPVISNRQVTEQIRLMDGESYLLGGILNRAETNSVDGYPWLSKIPVLGSLFASRNKQKTETELIFLLKPHIVRRPVAEEYASNAIYFGKELQGISQSPIAPPPTPGVGGSEGFFQPGAPSQRFQQPGVQPVLPGLPPGAVVQPNVGGESGVTVLPGQPGAPNQQQQFNQPGIIPVLPGLPGQPVPTPPTQQ